MKSTIIITILSIFILSTSPVLAMKGKLLLVGGGTERDTPNSWSTPAFQWAINQAPNRKAIIVHYQTESTFYPTYLTNVCGAVAAKNLIINSANANLQATYDTLMNYDFIFFRGGDQSFYYNYYKNTKTSQAINAKFLAGGVIGGSSAGLHILSGVVYNATDVSVTPVEAMINIANPAITLSNDLFNLFPNYVFDSHVAERGRFPRTIGFMAKWFNTTGQKIKGVTVDDLTAMGIDTSEVGVAFGTGAIGIYDTKSMKTIPYSISGKLRTDSIEVIQLLNGWKYNFKTQNVTTIGANIIQPPLSTEDNQSTIMLSGADDVASNSNFLDHFVKRIGKASLPIVIFTGTNVSLANSFRSNCISRGANKVKVISLMPGSFTITGIMDTLQQTNKFLFVGSNISDFNNILTSTGAGAFINSKIRAKGVAVGFVGGNARFAGKRIVSDNYTTAIAAYDSLLRTSKGLGLLKTTIIFPNAFQSTNTYENSVSATPYFMLRDSITHGIMLTGNSYLKYATKIDNKAYFSSDGQTLAIIMKNAGVEAGFSKTTSGKTINQKSRQVAGFAKISIAFIDTNSTFIAGNNVAYSAVEDSSQISTQIQKEKTVEFSDITLFPNPFDTEINIAMPSGEKLLSTVIFDLNGLKLDENQILTENRINLEWLKKGVFILQLHTNKGIYFKKLIK